MLAAGIDPGKHEAVSPSNPIDGRFHIRDSGDLSDNYSLSGKFIAVFSAIRAAILTNRLRADITHLARPSSYGGNWETHGEDEEGYVNYDALLVGAGSTLRTNVQTKDDPWGRFGAVFFVKEPDWSHTKVEVDELTAWMDRRHFWPPFFFPEGTTEGFRDPEHPRYSPKLACAIGAWEAVERNKSNMSVKATIVEWVTANAVTFGMVEADGVPSATGVEEVAKVTNWETRGGANRTGGEVVETPVPASQDAIENFTEMQQPVSRPSKNAPPFEPGGMDDDIPF